MKNMEEIFSEEFDSFTDSTPGCESMEATDEPIDEDEEELIDDDEDLEHWRPIRDFSHYLISDRGNVYSLRTKKILSPGTINGGYLYVVLCQNGKKKNKLVHALVLDAFVSECPVGFECNHVNHVRNDNRLLNLEYVTRSQNLIDRTKSNNYDFTFISTLPDGSTPFTRYKSHLFNDYFINETQIYQKIRDDRYRILDKRNAGTSCDRYYLRDSQHRQVPISVSYLRKMK